MKHWLTFLAWTLCTSSALADPPAVPATDSQNAAALVQRKLIEPLKKSESRRSRFSRGAPVAVERRLRVIDAQVQTDAHGRSFVRFAVDARYPGEQRSWSESALTGCAYPADGRVFVQAGSQYVPASAILGEDAAPVSDVCRARDA